MDSALTVSDVNPDPRFYPLRSNDVHMTIAGDYVRATGSLHQPGTGTLITNVSIEHQLSSGAGTRCSTFRALPSARTSSPISSLD